MTDRELLELAAKAAGIKIHHWSEGREPHECPVLNDGVKEKIRVFDPLQDDGDALRLAVKMGFINPGQWPCPGYIEADKLLQEKGCVDWYSATRRAIVRAAAEIGASMP